MDTVDFLARFIKDGKKILAEGANAALLDIDFGTYPYVTSSNTTIGALCTGLGVPPRAIEQNIGVVKAYLTRVGAGPFPTELDVESVDAKHLQSVGHEFGTTTGRPRRCGWLDLPAILYAQRINGFTALNLTKLDVLSGLHKLQIAVRYSVEGSDVPFPAHVMELEKVTVEYEELDGWTEDISKVRKFADLPVNAQKYVQRIEQEVGVEIKWIGVGADREDMFLK